jgi:hypothetical protein
MTGREDTVTYPQFLRLPDGDLLFLFREVASGNGDTYMNRYDLQTSTWANVHVSIGTQAPFIKGTGWNPNYNAYLNMPQLGGPDGDDLIVTWCWRYEPVGSDSPAGEDGYQTNNMLAFGRSPDAGQTWRRFNGTPYVLPISRNGESGNPATAAEHIVNIPEGSSLINQASTCLDANDNPVTCTWFAPGAKQVPANHRRQYMVVFRNDHGTPSTTDDTWDTRQVSQRANNPTGTKYTETNVRDLGRPIVVTDDQDRIIVAYRDDAENNGLTIVHSLPKVDDPDRLVWIQVDLTTENLGNYEPIIDNVRGLGNRGYQSGYRIPPGLHPPRRSLRPPPLLAHRIRGRWFRLIPLSRIKKPHPATGCGFFDSFDQTVSVHSGKRTISPPLRADSWARMPVQVMFALWTAFG